MRRGRIWRSPRRTLVLGATMILLALTCLAHADAPLKKLLILDFELLDDQEGVVPFP